MKQKKTWKVIFHHDGKLFEIYAKEVVQSNLYGFIEVGGILFGEKSAVVVDPAEEKLKAEFGNVKRTFIPLHALVRIDEVEKQGATRVTAVSGKGAKVTPFPGMPSWSPGKPPE